MSYRCGTRGLGKLGIPDDDPRVTCDGCGLVWRVRTDRPPPAWLLDGKAPKGWKKISLNEHHCPRCRQGRADAPSV